MLDGDIPTGMRRYTLVCDDDTARRVEGLAAEYDLTEQEVLEQLVGVGLEELD
jgi:hypothetical protein